MKEKLELTLPVDKIDGLPILVYRSDRVVPPHLVLEWIEKLGARVLTNYGDIASIFSKETYPEYPYPSEPVVPSGATEQHKLALNKTYEVQLQQTVRLVYKLRGAKTNVFGLMWEHLSNESQDVIKGTTEFATLRQDDPLALLKVIKRTHLVSARNKILDVKLDAERVWNETNMGRSSLIAYKQRIDAAILALKEAKSEFRPDAERQVEKFLSGLDMSRYHALYDDYLNGRVTVPLTTLEQAYQWVNNYKFLKIQGRQATVSTFYLEAQAEDDETPDEEDGSTVGAQVFSTQTSQPSSATDSASNKNLSTAPKKRPRRSNKKRSNTSAASSASSQDNRGQARDDPTNRQQLDIIKASCDKMAQMMTEMKRAMDNLHVV
mmetsp:Transcript_7072/g.12695  ORF Transcript_7072/g.12695 Transcript_7072/m.12695 type:complete len:378 (+) Transcript_7072:1269-2402(+)